MRKPTAFGKDSNYQTYAGLGKEIGVAKNEIELSRQINHLISEDVVKSQRAATVLHHVCDTTPELFKNYAEELVYVLNKPVHNSGPRVAFRILSRIKIPGKYLGNVVDLAFNYLNNVTTPVAIKVNAMNVIANQVEEYPDLLNELTTSIKNQYSYQPPAFKACVRKLSKHLKKSFME